MHIDANLILLAQSYGFLIYPLLFLIIFIETGIVIFPFLPGDSLIFASGALAAQGALSIFLLFLVLILAAIIGDSANYFIGKYLGNKIVQKGYIKQEHMQRTEQFYNDYGAKTIVLARFVPFVRTIAPFIAGVGKMDYKKFLAYNILGGILWVSLFLFLGFFFGSIPIIKNHFSIVLLAIIILSLVPAAVEILKHRKKKK